MKPKEVRERRKKNLEVVSQVRYAMCLQGVFSGLGKKAVLTKRERREAREEEKKKKLVEVRSV